MKKTSLFWRASIISLIGFSLPSFASAQSQTLNAPVATSQFYSTSTNKTIWSNSENYTALITAIEQLRDHGLTPEDYHLSALKSASLSMQEKDKLATDAWFSASAHMLYGKLNPTSVEPDWTAAKRDANLSEALKEALETNSVLSSLETFAPKQPGYTALKSELIRLRAEAEMPKTVVTAGEVLKPNMQNPRVLLLKTRLQELGYFQVDSSEIPTSVMDEMTVAAIKAFQRDMELDSDGAVGPATLAALNRGNTEKIDQVRVNMERWRWLPDDLGRRHLRANIAGFNVTAWKDGKIERSHLTIVGRPYRKTPVFSDKVSYLILNPWWETPNSLATRDKLPTFRKDPSAVERLGFQILDRQGQIVPASTIDWNTVSPNNFPYRLRQKPGELNALGQVKIMFPNKHNVYLHDTPTRGLFSQRQRAFSSGCLRTENPLDLSTWLLSETPGWTRERLDSIVATGKETRVDLAQSVPIHILYFTVVDEGEFGVRYLDDIYDRDDKVLSGLSAKSK